MKSLYKEHILEHYREPHNFGELEDPDVAVDVDNPSCGDELTVYARTENSEIQELTFTGSGCALSVAAASLLTDTLQGADVDDIKNVSEEDMFDLLGLEKDEVSPMRWKCVLLSRNAVQQLVEDQE